MIESTLRRSKYVPNCQANLKIDSDTEVYTIYVALSFNVKTFRRQLKYVFNFQCNVSGLVHLPFDLNIISLTPFFMHFHPP